MSDHLTLHALEPLAQFGVAGLMGFLWVWERNLSRRRESQLEQTHEQLRQKRTQLRMTIKALNRNSRVIERFEHTNRLTLDLLERLNHESPIRIQHDRDAAGRDRGLHLTPVRDPAAAHQPASDRRGSGSAE